MVNAGHVRVNRARVAKPAYGVGQGDVVTFAQGARIRVVRVESLGARRGPAVEAQMLYTDLTPAADPAPPRAGPRPTKKDRRALDEWKGDS